MFMFMSVSMLHDISFRISKVGEQFTPISDILLHIQFCLNYALLGPKLF
jgi:hypothetical protein